MRLYTNGRQRKPRKRWFDQQRTAKWLASQEKAICSAESDFLERMLSLAKFRSKHLQSPPVWALIEDYGEEARKLGVLDDLRDLCFEYAARFGDPRQRRLVFSYRAFAASRGIPTEYQEQDGGQQQ